MVFLSEFSKCIPEVDSPASQIELFASGTSRGVYLVDENVGSHLIDDKLSRRIDRFSRFAITAMEQFVTVAKKSHLPSRIGMVVGNMMGGWAFGQRELHNLHFSGFDKLSPFQATAWFPAAPQGEASILFGLTGYSKTLSGGMLCGLEAIQVGIQTLNLGKADVVIVGVTESLKSGLATEGVSDIDARMLGEGACFALLTKAPIDQDCIEIQCCQRHTMFKDLYCCETMNAVRIPSDYDPFYPGVQTLLDLSNARASLMGNSFGSTKLSIASRNREFNLVLMKHS